MSKYSKTHTVYTNADGIEVPSITTILKILNKPFLTKWANAMGFKRKNIDRLLEESSRLGTLTHDLIYSYMSGLPFSWEGKEWDKEAVILRFDKFLTWKKAQEQFEPIFMEKQLVSSKFAGTCDFYGNINSKKTILDYKSSKKIYSSMFLQLSGYTVMLEEQGYEVEQVGILLVNGKECEVKYLTREQLTPYIEVFKTLANLFHSWYDLNMSEGWGDILA